MTDPLRWRRVPGQGAYARPERERRFLVRSVPASDAPPRRIEDRYLRGTTLRLRSVRVGDESVFKLTQKVRVAADPSDVSITNVYLTAEEHALLCALPADLLTKTRTLHPAGEHVLVVDTFSGRLQGLRLAEVEVQDLAEPLLLPGWLGSEVTHDDRWSGGRLAAADDVQLAKLLDSSLP